MNSLARYRLRPELEIIRLAPDRFMVVDPATRKHFEFGPDERYLLYLLGRAESPEEILERYRERFGKTVSHQQLLGFLENLRRLGLTTDDDLAAESAEVSSEFRLAEPDLSAGREPQPFLNFVFSLDRRVRVARPSDLDRPHPAREHVGVQLSGQ
jgi:hypothetical protein